MNVALQHAQLLGVSTVFLHASEIFRPFYRRLHFESVKTEWFKFPLDTSVKVAAFADCSCSVEFMTINSANAEVLCSLNASVSQRFNGPLQRIPEYVSSWIASGTNNGQIVAAVKDTGQESTANIFAYAIVGEYPKGTLQLKDFGASEDLMCDYHKCGNVLMALILAWATRNVTVAEGASCGFISMSIPKPLADFIQINPSSEWISKDPHAQPAALDIDEGWMFLELPLDASEFGCLEPPQETDIDTSESQSEESQQGKCIDFSDYLFWRIDHF